MPNVGLVQTGGSLPVDIVCFFGRPASGKTGPSSDARDNGYETRVCSDDVKAYFADPALVAASDLGAMWSDGTVTTVMDYHLEKPDTERLGFGLDGYVRSPGQFRFLMNKVSQKGWRIIVIWVDTPAEVCKFRAATRRQSFIDRNLEPRPDDHPDVVNRRLKEYDGYGPPTLRVFEDAGVRVVRIDGTLSPEEVIRQSHEAIFGL